MKETAYQSNIFVELNPVDSLASWFLLYLFSNNHLRIDEVKIALLLKGCYSHN